MSSTPRSGAVFTAVTYVGLPIGSGGAHLLGRMSRRTAYERTMSFLQACTEPVGPARHGFTVCNVPQLARQHDLEAELELRFGQGRRVSVPADRVEEALEMLDDVHPQPTNQWGLAPLWFSMESGFRLLDPATGQALPGQDAVRYAGKEYVWNNPLGTSSLSLSIHNSASLAINLCIPDADDELLHRIVPWLQEHLPFKMSAKHWRSWTPTKTGSFKSRRIPPPGSG